MRGLHQAYSGSTRHPNEYYCSATILLPCQLRSQSCPSGAVVGKVDGHFEGELVKTSEQRDIGYGSRIEVLRKVLRARGRGDVYGTSSDGNELSTRLPKDPGYARIIRRSQVRD